MTAPAPVEARRGKLFGERSRRDPDRAEARRPARVTSLAPAPDEHDNDGSYHRDDADGDGDQPRATGRAADDGERPGAERE